MNILDALKQQGWKDHSENELMINLNETDFYCRSVDDNRYIIGLQEPDGERTKLFNGRIADEAALKRILQLTVESANREPEEYESKLFALMSILEKQGWEGDEYDRTKAINDEDETEYHCSEMDINSFVITKTDDFTDHSEDLYNGRMENEKDAKLVFTAIGIKLA